MLQNDINLLTPKAKKKVQELIALCGAEGITIRLGETKRELATQACYYLRGRIANDPKARKALSILGKVHAWEFSDSETQKHVTWTLDSNHLDGNAADLIVIINGKKSWNYKSKEWKRVITLAKKVGLTCGADWNPPDPCHVENREV